MMILELLMMVFLHIGSEMNLYHEYVTQPPAETCWEDEPCWDCETMGNLICGSVIID
jgi:hypothetical protein